ncbi:MAG: lipocalin family protein [Bdellovibrio sp.]|nr:lipocalin family protein [Bdellovibrio sp.]
MKSLLISMFMIFNYACVSQAQTEKKDVQTMPSVDLNKYLGTWYEVASIPQSFQKQCVSSSKAEYSMAEDGLIKVMNSCLKATGEISSAEGRARVEDKVTNSKLKVTFVKLFKWVFPFGGNYWILDVDGGYTVALVGDPSREYAWILSRQPVLSTAAWIEAEKSFKAQGYDSCKILTSVQKDGLTARQPLCQFVNKL